MKGFKKIAALIAVLGLAISGCSATKPQQQRKTVYASFYPMAQFTKMVAGDLWDVKTIVEGNEEPHDYELQPKQLEDILKADLVVYNGLDMEPYIDSVKEQMKDANKFVEASKGIDVIKDEDHEEDEHHDEKDEDHHHDEKHEHHHDVDPHVWLSPKQAIIELTNIKDKFVAIDAENAKVYNENYEKALKQLQQLDKDYADKLSTLKNKDLVTAHEAFGYLARDYNLSQIGVKGLGDDDEPTPQDLAKIIEFVKEHNVKVIFEEELSSSKIVDTLAKEANVQLTVLNTLEVNDNSKDYVQLMNDNLDTLTKYLNE